MASKCDSKFFTDLDRGKQGESEVLEILKNQKSISQVIDVSDIRKYQAVEIDAIVKLCNQKTVAIEIKTDFFEKTGNIVFEVFSSYEHRTAGGFVKTQSDFILYYFPNIKTLYSINTASFKQFILNNKNHLRFGKMGDDAMGFIIPIKKLMNHTWFRRVC